MLTLSFVAIFQISAHGLLILRASLPVPSPGGSHGDGRSRIQPGARAWQGTRLPRVRACGAALSVVIGLRGLPARLFGAVIGMCGCRHRATHANESLAVPAIGSPDGVRIVRPARPASDWRRSAPGGGAER